MVMLDQKRFYEVKNLSVFPQESRLGVVHNDYEARRSMSQGDKII